MINVGSNVRRFDFVPTERTQFTRQGTVALTYVGAAHNLVRFHSCSTLLPRSAPVTETAQARTASLQYFTDLLASRSRAEIFLPTILKSLGTRASPMERRVKGTILVRTFWSALTSAFDQ